MKTIKIGDVIWIDFLNELIEVIGCLPEEGQIHYWGSSKPHHVGTRKCMGMAAFIAFKGEKLDNVGDMREVYENCR